MNAIELNKESLIEFALRQVDNIGFELQRRGISGQVNRHNLAALAMTKQQQIKGEMARYELKLGLQRLKAEKAKQQALNTVENIIDHLPAPLAKPLNRVKSYVA